MLYREIVAVSSEIHTEPVSTLYGRKEEFFSVKLGSAYSLVITQRWRLDPDLYLILHYNWFSQELRSILFILTHFLLRRCPASASYQPPIHSTVTIRAWLLHKH